MVLKILPNDVRSMLCASSQINNYKRAVEELVYNSLDAESTSIAIRINIQENRLQVVDNGNGINKNDFEILGQRYMTSKFTDISTLKSTPKHYGYRGEFLANIIEISENVKITARHKEGEDTFAKQFSKGRKLKVTKICTRPSKGTTIDISGFLYNLNIRKEGIYPVNDLQNIKSFLEQLSLVHSSVSISLRDDSKNEIIFKIHKNRDIYQTLSTLFNIEMQNVQELQVEKNLYKVKGFISKSESDILKYWVFLNGQFINNSSKLHKIINGYMKKYFIVQNKKKSKSKINHDENHLLKKIPFYFIFITCPYGDYVLNSTTGQSFLQFKHWDQIKTLLEKLVKFYVGDINLKEINKPKIARNQTNNKDMHDHHDQIKEIIDRILGRNLKPLGALRFENGVKGEFIKRNMKNKVKHNNKKVDCHLQRPVQTQLSKKYKDYSNQMQDLPSNKVSGDVPQRQTNINTSKAKYIPNRESTENMYSQILVEKEIEKPKYISPMKKNKNSKKKNVKQKNKNVFSNMSSKMARHKTNYGSNRIIENKSSLFKKSKKVDTAKIAKTAKRKKIDTDYYLSKGTELIATAKSFLEGQNIYSMERQKEFKLLNGINQRKQIQHCQDHCAYNLDFVKPKSHLKPFKTTYDLVNTIFETQQCKHLNQNVYDYEIIGTNQNHNADSPAVEPNSPQNYCSNLIDDDSQKEESCYFIRTSKTVLDCNLRCEYSYCRSQFTNIENTAKDIFMKPLVQHDYLKLEDIFQNNENAQSFYLSNEKTVSSLTYKSHNYDKNTSEDPNAKHYISRTNKPYSMRFITNQSKDNFTISKNKPKCAYNNQLLFKNKRGHQACCSKNIKHNLTVNKSYTVEYTNNEYRLSDQSSFGTFCAGSKSHYTHETHGFSYEPIPGLGNTYTVKNHCFSSKHITHKLFQAKCTDSNEILDSESIITQNYYSYSNRHEKLTPEDSEHINYIFLSSSKEGDEEKNIHKVIEPLDVCETVYLRNKTKENFSYTVKENIDYYGILFNEFSNHASDCDLKKYETEITDVQTMSRDDISHHFSNTMIEKISKTIDNTEFEMNETTAETNMKLYIANKPNIQNGSNENKSFRDMHNHINDNVFDFRNRPRYLPKGMSQIFDKCDLRSAYDYNLDEEYFANGIYNDFANDVQMQTEIYEPAIQNLELTTTDINKIKNKFHHENTSLMFDVTSLREAQVLNQVDSKFIAATIKERYKGSEIASEYLALFDQHAVHERIRLEKNLSDYFIEDKWTSTQLDLKLKLPKDEIIYLHNYKDKFCLLGLQWSNVTENEVLLNSIPLAILGKNPREVDKVMKAIKNLIVEEINSIKLQKGCISLHPKSIMDLVFSEACRYAIKFGDKLSKNDCNQLIKDLSNCKTPFQCAHGRPVMAVLIEIKQDMHAYKIDPASLKKNKPSKFK